MKHKLLGILICPKCRSPFDLDKEVENEGEIESGVLACRCGTYPIVDSIPRILNEYWTPIDGSSPKDSPTSTDEKLKSRTRASFGYQWSHFGQMSETFEQNFLNYVAPIQPSFFPGKLGLDAGCGFGRHVFYASKYGAEMIGLDASRAIDVARRNATGDRTHFVQGDIFHPPFRDGAFDFVYSIGVLHHLPDPEAGFRALESLSRQGAPVWIWVYSKRRRLVNFLLEAARAATTHLPFSLLKSICFLAAVIDYGFFVLPGRYLTRTPLRFLVSPRLRVYGEYPFQVCYADWFDRLSAPIRFYYDEDDLTRWAERAGWSNYRIEPTGLYGFRLQREEERQATCPG